MGSALAFLPEERAPDLEPRFYVEPADGRKNLPELARVTQFRREMRMLAPKVTVWANANAGKRSAAQASAEGIRGGVFDYACVWEPARIAFPEFKGYDARGRAGVLSRKQIEWGNAMVDIGHHVACFFTPAAAIEWLRAVGAPIRDRRGL